MAIRATSTMQTNPQNTQNNRFPVYAIISPRKIKDMNVVPEINGQDK